MKSSSTYTLSLIWQKAVVAGTFWGALEIILGSVLHNLMLPLIAGTLLSFAGIMIMTAISIGQPQRGLYWRAALVCAMLKSVSPSAVILTPMIGIMLEGLLMEVGVLLLGRNLWGLMVGGGLAVLSVPFFKIGRLFMMYGSSIYDLYVSVFKISTGNVAQQTPNYWPVVGVSIAYFLFGFFAVILGYSIGKNFKGNQWSIQIGDTVDGNQSLHQKSFLPLFYSILHLSFLIFFLSITSKIPNYLSLIIATSYIVFTLLFYPRARFPFKKMSLLIPVVLFSFVVPLISVSSITNFDWVVAGSKIMMRAFMVVVSFAAIGTELGKPCIKGYFAGGIFQPAYMATSLAFNALPEYMGRIKRFELRGRNPISQIRNLVSDTLAPSIPNNVEYPFILIVGDRGEGKTTFVKNLVEVLSSRGVKYTGFYALGEGSCDLRTGYNLVLLPEKTSMPLSKRIAQCGTPQKSFEFYADALKAGSALLASAARGDVVIIDEIGKMELAGEAWANAFTNLVRRRSNPIIVTVRDINLESLIQHWSIQNPVIINIKNCDYEKVLGSLSLNH